LCGGLAAADGGFFPESWAWTSVLTLTAATILLLVRRSWHFGLLDVIYAGALLLLAAWVALSLLWSPTVTGAVDDAWRLLAYVGAVALTLVVVDRRTVPHLLGGILVGVSAVGGYALLTRLLPDRLGDFESLPTLRLADPIGYWNGLGAYCAMGTLLAVGVAARANRTVLRMLAAAVPVGLVAAMYLTFSRGAWAALGVALVAWVVIDPRRLQLIAFLLALGPWPALGVLAASRADGLTREGLGLDRAVEDGKVLLFYLAVLALAAAATAWALSLAERRLEVRHVWRVVFTGALAAVALAAAGWVWAEHGSPWRLADRAWADFHRGPDSTAGDLSTRLFDLSSNGRIELWGVAWDDFRRSPVVGNGAGSFEQSFYRNRDSQQVARDGHSLYAETLGELGMIGAVLLGSSLAVPLVAAVRARRTQFATGAAAAYVVFLAHAAVDWDWELAGVAVTALMLGASLFVYARDERSVREPSQGVRFSLAACVAALSALALWSLLATVPLGRAREAFIRGDFATAVDEAKDAERWSPWSADPWQLRGDGELAQGRVPDARRSYAEAVAAEPGEWLLWLDLAVTSSGSAQRRALARAAALNPNEEQIRIVQEAVRNRAADR
jgi:hypothetical protein